MWLTPTQIPILTITVVTALHTLFYNQTEWAQLIPKKSAIFLNATTQLVTDVTTLSASCLVPATNNSMMLAKCLCARHTELQKFKLLRTEDDDSTPITSIMTTITMDSAMLK
jgi:hypothetical protein